MGFTRTYQMAGKVIEITSLHKSVHRYCKDYALKNNIPTKVIWMVVRRANRTVMEECGFLVPKENDNDE